MDFTARPIDAEYERRYVAAGFWGEGSLGALLQAGLREAASHPFTVHSDRKDERALLTPERT